MTQLADDEFDAIGLSHAVDGFAGGIMFVLGTPRVWGWAAVPAVMMLILMCGGGALGTWGTIEVLRAWLGEQQARGSWGEIGYWLLVCLLVPLIVVMGVLLGLLLAQPLSGYALERIAHAQQRALTGHAGPTQPFLVALWVNLCTVTFTLLAGTPVLAALFVINMFFPPAAVVTVPLKFLVCSWMLAWNFLDYPLGLRGLGVRARLRWVLRHFGAFTLFGVLWAGLCVVPGVVLVLLPMGVAGATRMILRDDPGLHDDR
jgi:CysZ protein